MELLRNMSLEKLVEIFELTSNMNDENIPTVRGWLMEEIEKRNPEGFGRWLDDDCPDDSRLRKYVLA